MAGRSSFPEALNASLQVAYKEGRQAVADTSYRQLLATETTSANAKKVVFYGDKIKLRRFRGERKPDSELEYSTMMDLDEWEASRVYRNTTLDDDQSGGFLVQRAREFGSVVEYALEEETLNALRLGTSYKSFDRANFFDTTHCYVTGSGATVNLLNPGVSYSYANMNLAGLGISTNTIRQADWHFQTLLSDKKRPLGGRLTHIVVRKGSDNAHAAKEIANSQLTVSTAATSRGVNTLQGAYQIIEVSYGLGGSEWIALDLSDAGARPITLLQHSVTPSAGNMQLEVLAEGTDRYFWNKEIAYGVYGRMGWNMGDPRTAYLFGSTTTSIAVDDLESQRIGDPNAR